jgi:hypothetical protein
MALPSNIEVIIASNETVIVEMEENIYLEMQVKDITIPEPIPTLSDTSDEVLIYNTECVICCETLSNKENTDHKSTIVFPCKHGLCYECTVTYLTTLLCSKADITCPICRSILLRNESHVYKETYSQYVGVEMNSPDTTISTIMTQQDPDEIIAHEQEYYHVRRRRRERLFMLFPCVFVVIIALVLLIIWSSTQ